MLFPLFTLLHCKKQALPCSARAKNSSAVFRDYCRSSPPPPPPLCVYSKPALSLTAVLNSMFWLDLRGTRCSWVAPKQFEEVTLTVEQSPCDASCWWCVARCGGNHLSANLFVWVDAGCLVKWPALLEVMSFLLNTDRPYARRFMNALKSNKVEQEWLVCYHIPNDHSQATANGNFHSDLHSIEQAYDRNGVGNF